MKQILQDLRSGEVVLEEVPAPVPGAGAVLIRTHRSLISAGTERMLNSFANASYLDKARQQPDRVREVLQKARVDGVAATVNAVQSKLDNRMSLGYCSAGEIVAVGTGVTEYEVGDRVISNGPHAELAVVPLNLIAKIPDGVDYDRAVFTVISSIGLQGVRLIAPTLGERVAVVGLGLVGLLAVQLLRANGCQVIGFDYVAERVEAAREFGATAHDLSKGIDPVEAAMHFSDRVGVDGVLVTASTSSDEVMRQAAQMSRQRGRIVLTGVVGLQLQRADFYDKELSFAVSCSYGPGRYDSSYEMDGHDYPIGFVRWTQQRNFEAVLELLRDGSLQTERLTTQQFDFAHATQAYEALSAGSDIGIVLRYDVDAPLPIDQRTVSIAPARPALSRNPTVAIIGAGAFANGVLIPELTEAHARIKYISSSGGTSGSAAARRFGIEFSTTDNDEIFADPEVDAVVITTRHNSHASLACDALDASKHVFIEKPLAIDAAGLEAVLASHRRATDRDGASPILMVGFNRRFAPVTSDIRAALQSRQGPLASTYICNAGALPSDHWTHDPAVGGGRIIGEACHFIDYLVYLTGCHVQSVYASSSSAGTEDVVSIQLEFTDGSIGTVQYFANGSKALAKERCEVFFDGKVVQMDSFKALRVHGMKKAKRMPAKQNKGHGNQFQEFVNCVRKGRPSPISLGDIVNVTEASFAAVESMKSGLRMEIKPVLALET